MLLSTWSDSHRRPTQCSALGTWSAKRPGNGKQMLTDTSGSSECKSARTLLLETTTVGRCSIVVEMRCVYFPIQVRWTHTNLISIWNWITSTQRCVSSMEIQKKKKSTDFFRLSHLLKHATHFLAHFELFHVDKVNQSQNDNETCISLQKWARHCLEFWSCLPHSEIFNIMILWIVYFPYLHKNIPCFYKVETSKFRISASLSYVHNSV